MQVSNDIIAVVTVNDVIYTPVNVAILFFSVVEDPLQK